MKGGPWYVAGRTYRDWSKVPRWFRKRARAKRARDLFPLSPRTPFPWRSLFGLVGLALVLGLIAKVLWCL